LNDPVRAVLPLLASSSLAAEAGAGKRVEGPMSDYKAVAEEMFGAIAAGGDVDAAVDKYMAEDFIEHEEIPGLDIYLNYRGNCEEAFRFYEQHLGGKMNDILRHKNQPNPNLPADWGEKVLHARIEIGDTMIMGADIPQSEPMRSAYLTLSLDSEVEAERVYRLLTDGGEVFMKMEKTPFANRFAMLRDRFGTSWMLLHQPATA
jgi:PhnB protein